MIDTKIKNLLFDYGGVLVDLDAEACFRAFEELGIEVRSFIGMYGQRGIFSKLERGEETVHEFCEALRRMSANHDVTDEQIIEAWKRFTIGVPQERLQCILRLKERYRVFLLSNTNIIHWQQACDDFFSYDNHQVGDFFEKTFLSFELHKEKPDPAIFREVLSLGGIKGEETLFIDDAEVNCEAARKEGFEAYHAEESGLWMSIFD